jgi:high affinity Mn2+ porin
VPDINAARTDEQDKSGFGLSAEQALTANVGIFARANWADGKAETYVFTEIDPSVSGGLLVTGSR